MKRKRTRILVLLASASLLAACSDAADRVDGGALPNPNSTADGGLPARDTGSELGDADAATIEGSAADAQAEQPFPKDAGCAADGGVCADASEALGSPYLRQLAIPACGDPDNPPAGVHHIRREEDWARVNDMALRVFCVHPGDYVALGPISLQRDGTVAAPRVIRGVIPGDTRQLTSPVRLPVDQQPRIGGLVLEQAKHWVIAGLALGGMQQRGTLVRLGAGAQSNVLDRLLVESGGDESGQVELLGPENLLQRSVIRTTLVTTGKANHCVRIGGSARGSRLVANEIYDCAGDAVHIGGQGEAQTADGVIVADNDIYCAEFCGKGESAIELESGGSNGADSWLRIERNRMWGHLAGGGAEPGNIHQALIEVGGDELDRSYVLLLGNVLFDAYYAVKPAEGGRLSSGRSSHWSIIGNLIYDVDIAAFYLGHNTPTAELYFNTVIGVRDGGRWLDVDSTSADADVRCNLVVNGRSYRIRAPGAAVVNNALLGQTQSDDEQNLRGSVVEADLREYCIETRRWTDPRRQCVPNARPSIVSSLTQACEAGAGARPGVGVDDETPSWVGLDGDRLGPPRVGAL
jgi:hypothetical protein